MGIEFLLSVVLVPFFLFQTMPGGEKRCRRRPAGKNARGGRAAVSLPAKKWEEGKGL